ncbi:hypothetical protein ACFL2P_02355 [Candidatus Moduliflexota bacterium]
MASGDFVVEHQCPQCGAPVNLGESESFFTCRHCRVRLYLFAAPVFRYYLPHEPSGEETVFVPYWHLRGAFFFLEPFNVRHAMVDATFRAAGPGLLPPTLGLRAQAMKLRIAGKGVAGRFLPAGLTADVLMGKIEALTGSKSGATTSTRIYHRTFVGETKSIVYAPIFLRDEKVYDAVLDRLLGSLGEDGAGVLTAADDPAAWQAGFLPAVCPNCGWDLPGSRRSIALICKGCAGGWCVDRGRFRRLDYAVHPGERGPSTMYHPFWRMKVRVEGLSLSSFADLARFANLPLAMRKEWESRDLVFWAPAFHLRPAIFLRLARRLSSLPLEVEEGATDPGEGELYPATLGERDAFESVRLTLASMAVRKKDVFPLLPQAGLRLQQALLTYLPFSARGGDFIGQTSGVSFRRNALRP